MSSGTYHAVFTMGGIVEDIFLHIFFLSIYICAFSKMADIGMSRYVGICLEVIFS